MDVSRIEAISPKQIDWRKLTAPEIIEYKEQGVEVPSQYLQWAQSFLNDVNAADTDETTYETANSQVSSQTSVQQQTGLTDSETSSTTQELSAKEKRQQMQKDGESITGIAVEFKGISQEKAKESEAAGVLAENLEAAGANSIETLDAHMSEIMSRIQETKSKIQTKSTDLKGGNLSEIAELNNYLKSLGASGQNLAASYGLNIDTFNSVVNGQLPISLSGVDYGNETIDLGEIFRNMPFMAPLGRGVIKAGENAVAASDTALELQTQAMSSLQENKNQVEDYQRQIQDATGIGAMSKSDEKGENAGEESTLDKDNKNETVAKNDPANPENQTKDAASADLEQILKAKIRRGENVGNDQLA